MNQGRIIVITGAPGTGKTTTASAVAKESDLEKSVHMHTDDFYHYLSKGAIPPHLPESNEQNLIVIEAFLEAAKRYARGGYDVIVDGIIGPWFLKPWQSLVREHYSSGQRWIKCEICGEIKPTYEFFDYGGKNRVNSGICSSCNRSNR